MPLDLAKFRNWARIPHTVDDPAIQLAYLAAVRELEERTGWCYDSVARTQYVAEEPEEINERKLVLLARQPAILPTVTINLVITGLSTYTINGLVYADMDVAGIEYPTVISYTAGNGTINELLEMALLQRVTQLVNSRGDDTQALASDYWDRICPMMGKGVG